MKIESNNWVIKRIGRYKWTDWGMKILGGKFTTTKSLDTDRNVRCNVYLDIFFSRWMSIIFANKQQALNVVE